jgi:hypothetical protein
MCSQISNFLL